MTKTTSTTMAAVVDRPGEVVQSTDPVTEQAFLLRLATDPAVDVDKLRAILEMHKDVKSQQAKMAFNKAFATMQPLVPVIAETATGDKGMTYAPLEDIVEQVRDLLAQHGFSFGWESRFPADNAIHVTCTLTHIEGHDRTSEFVAAPDQSGSKNAIQARASAVSYGQRYTLKSLLGIVTRKEDDDAAGAGGPDGPPRPKDYDDKIDDLTAAADEGFAKFELAWKSLDPKYRAYASEMDTARMSRVKQKALDVDKKNGVKR